MTDQDLMKANNITGTPDTPDIPLIELKPEKEDIPDEVLHNIATDCKKEDEEEEEEEEEETITVGKQIEKRKDYTKLKKVIKIVLLVLVLIINFYPMVASILEIVLRAVNNYEFNGSFIYTLLFSFIFLIALIKDCCQGKILDCEINGGVMASIVIIEVLTFLPEIILYYSGESQYHLEGFVKSFIKFKIISYFFVIGINIILGIISGYINLSFI